jgi:hypothetical protein
MSEARGAGILSRRFLQIGLQCRRLSLSERPPTRRLTVSASDIVGSTPAFRIRASVLQEVPHAGLW